MDFKLVSGGGSHPRTYLRKLHKIVFYKNEIFTNVPEKVTISQNDCKLSSNLI